MDKLSEQGKAKTHHWQTYPAARAKNIDHVYKTHAIDGQTRNVLVSAVCRVLEPGASVLDVGCGTGDISVALHDAGYRVSGLDVSPGMLEVFKLNAENRDIPIMIGDIFEMPASQEKFDVAVARYVFSHYQDFSLLLRKIAEHVKCGGYIIFDSFSSDALKTAVGAGPEQQVALAEKVFHNLAHFGGDALQAFCSENGLVVEGRYPSSFFHRNPLFCVSYDKIADYDRELATHTSEPAVQQFMQWFQEKLAPGIGADLTGAVVNVIKKYK